MPFWTDKVALVTGGSAGLGLAIARELHSQGALVAIAARDRVRLETAAASIDHEANCVAIAADVTEQADVDRLIAETVARWGRLDLLVNCAGRSARGAIRETTAEQFKSLLEVNFLSTVRCTQAALSHLLATKGYVVHIGSLASKVAAKHLGAYPASKFPLAAYAQQLRLELAAEKLHVLLVCPGPLRRDDAGERYVQEAANLPPEARQPGGGAKLTGIDPAWLARRILRACERREVELVVPARVRLLCAISQLWPRLGDWLLTRYTS